MFPYINKEITSFLAYIPSLELTYISIYKIAN